MHVHNVIILHNVLCSVSVFRGLDGFFIIAGCSFFFFTLLYIELCSSQSCLFRSSLGLLCSHSIYLLQFLAVFISFDYFLLLLLLQLLLLLVVLELWQAPACKIHNKCITTFFSRHIQRNVI